MQRLKPRDVNEEGAVAVLVALLLVVLMGFAAIAIDIGVISSERAQLQNGADAAALAVAQKCARDITDPLCSTTSSLAGNLANSNALDGLSNVNGIQLDKTAGTVSVNTTAKEINGTNNSVSLFFASVLGFPTAPVSMQSKAAWGGAKSGRTAFPLAFSICQVSNQIDGGLQLLQDHGSRANPSCNYGPSGAAVDGGYGWLVQDSGKCGATIDLAISEGGSNTGNNAPINCDSILTGWANAINSGQKAVVLLPIFNSVTGTGSGAVYKLVAFAAFKVTGWKFTGNMGLPYEFQSGVSAATGVTSATTCTGNCRGIIGQFITYVSLADGYALGPVNPYGQYGATIVHLTL